MNFKIISQKISSGYLFLSSFLLVFVITPLFQKGVFGDGLMYLAVAFNRYKGYGSFWKQRYSETSMSFFCEQPPLYFESLGWFYKIFGGAEVAEKIFTALLLFLTVLLSVKIWNKLTGGKRKDLAWLPALAMFCVPVFTWSYCNQVIETMVVPLALLVFYLQLVFLDTKNATVKTFSFFGIIAALFVLFLTKGIQSDFLVVGLLIAAFTYGRKKFFKVGQSGLLLLAAFAGICGLVFILNPEAQYWLKSYFDKRIIATFNNKGATAGHHIDIIIRYFSELLPVFGFFILVSVYLITAKKYSLAIQLKNFAANKKALWLVLISLSASLPLAVTLEQRGFYLSPAFPFMVLALCLLYRNYLLVLFKPVLKRRGVFNSIGAVVLAIAMGFFIFNKDGYKRDEGMIKDVGEIKKLVARGSLIGINQSTWNTFSLHSYLNKENDNSLAVTDTLQYFIQEKENKDPIPGKYEKANPATFSVDVYVLRQKDLH